MTAMGESTNDLLFAALEYAYEGLEVFPVDPQKKSPMSPVSQYQATTDEATIRQWWKRWPNALIGHRLSEDQIILDIDVRHGGMDTWRAIKAETGAVITRTHFSGRRDGGGHIWFDTGDEEITSTAELEAWAKARGVGHEVSESRWTSGIDLLRRGHRYTILPPSPHPETGEPYEWAPSRGLEMAPAPLPPLLRELLRRREPPAAQPVASKAASSLLSNASDSIADWYCQTASWTDLLTRHGWTLVGGDGESDGSTWRHPQATAEHSATIRHNCLFVYSPNTGFEPTAPGDVHGYTLFKAMATLEHRGDLSEAARTARALKGPEKPLSTSTRVATSNASPVTQEGDEDSEQELQPSPTIQDLLAEPEPDYDWLIEGVLERGDRLILTGPEGGGKSTFMRQIATQVAAGLHPFGEKDIKPLKVLFVDLENSKRHVKREFAPMRKEAGTDLGEDTLRIEIRPEGIDLTGDEDPVWLEERICANRPDVLLIGPLYKLADGDPTEEKVAKRVATTLDRLRTQYNFALIMEAHSPHASQGKRPERPYGASLWVRWPEFGLHLAKEGHLRHWRGARDERQWPVLMERGGAWPWTAVTDAKAVSYAQMVAAVKLAGQPMTVRELAVELNISKSQVQRAIDANREHWESVLDAIAISGIDAIVDSES